MYFNQLSIKENCKAHKNIKLLCALLSGENFKVKRDQTKLHQHRAVCSKGNTLYIIPTGFIQTKELKWKFWYKLDMLREAFPHQKGYFLEKFDGG